MEPRGLPDPAPDADLVSLLAFWVDAGVDTAFEDSPVNRLSPPPPTKVEPRRAPTLPSAARAATQPLAPSAAQSPALAEQIERARALARGAPDWPSLQAAIAAFDGAPRPRAAPTVIGRGADQPTLLVVGEGPSAEDEAAGFAFSGRTGALLDRMLNAASVAERSLILPTAFWRGRDRAAASALEAVSAPFLARAVELLRPRAMLLAGEAAVRSMLNRPEPILQMRGRWAAWASAEGDEQAFTVPALPIFHPAFLLQHPNAKKRTWGDLLLLIERLAQP